MAHRIWSFEHIAQLESDVPVQVVLCRQIDLSVCCTPGPDWRWRPGRPRTPWIDQLWWGLKQFTSGTLEACHPPKPCSWSDAMAPASYATLMMTSTSSSSSTSTATNYFRPSKFVQIKSRMHFLVVDNGDLDYISHYFRDTAMKTSKIDNFT